MFSSLYWRQSLRSRRDVYYTFAVYVEDYTCSVYFSVQLVPTVVTQEGVNTGALFFFFLFFFFAPPSSCGACLRFYREKGSAVPFPRRPLRRILCTHEAFQLFTAFYSQVRK